LVPLAVLTGCKEPPGERMKPGGLVSRVWKGGVELALL